MIFSGNSGQKVHINSTIVTSLSHTISEQKALIKEGLGKYAMVSPSITIVKKLK